MKRILWISLVTLQSVSFAQISYVGSLQEAFSEASKANKKVFIKYYSENCSHCQKLQQVLEIDSIHQFYSDQFVCYKIESEHAVADDYNFLKKHRIYIENVPCLLFFDADKTFIHYGQPKQEPSAVMKAARVALDPVERSSNLPRKYAQGERDMLTLKRYSKLAQLQKDTATVNLLANEIFDRFPKDQLLTKNSLANVSNYVKSINNGFYVFWMNHYTKLDSISPEIKLADKEKVFKDILSDNINDFKQIWTLDDFKRVRAYIEITRLGENPYSFFWEEESKLLQQSAKFTECWQLAEKMLESEKNKPYSVVYCINFYSELFTDGDMLKKLKKKMDLIFPLIPQSDLKGKMYCYNMRIYKKLKDSKAFEKAKQEAKQFLQENQLDMNLYNELTK